MLTQLPEDQRTIIRNFLLSYTKETHKSCINVKSFISSITNAYRLKLFDLSALIKYYVSYLLVPIKMKKKL